MSIDAKEIFEYVADLESRCETLEFELEESEDKLWSLRNHVDSELAQFKQDIGIDPNVSLSLADMVAIRDAVLSVLSPFKVA